MSGMDVDEDEAKVQVRFFARAGGGIESVQVSIPDTAFAVPSRLTRKGLAEVINGLLELDPPQRFDFLINGDLLRSSLETFLANRHLSTELTIKIEVIKPVARPSPAPTPELEDWVGCISPAAADGLLASGLYNGSVCITALPPAETQGGAAIAHSCAAAEAVVSPPAHEAPIKGVDLAAHGDNQVTGPSL
jgi:hypothetical protein